MECPSCAFQNIPGTQECVRCRTLLNLEAVNFIPPRAASGRMQRQAVGALTQARFRVAEGWSDVGRALRLPDIRGLGVRHALMALVPGLPQIRGNSAGIRFVGWGVLAVWLLMLTTAAVTIGSGFSVLLCFGLVSVHSFSVSLMMTPALQTTPLLMRVLVGISLYFALLFGEYWPLRAALGNCTHVLPVAGVMGGRPISNGDVLLYTGAWTRPASWKAGDVVVSMIEQTGSPHGEAYWIPAGLNVDRIVAVTGDVVRTHGGVLTVNGEEPEAGKGPLRRMINMPEFEFEVPEHSVVVLPSMLQTRGLPPAAMQSVSIVPEENVLGRVLWRARPWSKAGRIGGLE